MRLSWILILVTGFSPLFAQIPEVGARGDPAAAELYLAWAEQQIAEGHWGEALAALERAGDFSDVSSDLSFLLARARDHEGKPRRTILDALDRSIAIDRWNRYSAAQARLLAAKQLVVMRNYWGALNTLAAVPENADRAELRLSALRGLAETGGSSPEFRSALLAAMDRYPRDPRPLRIFFEYAHNKNPVEHDLALMELALRRLPFVLEAEPYIACLAAPFIKDRAAAARMISAYINGEKNPNPASIPEALRLGVMGADDAVDKLFFFADDSAAVLSKEIIVKLDALLDADEARERLAKKLHSFSGIITADNNNDGYPESRAACRDGVIQTYKYDSDQDDLFELEVFFNPDGSPRQAVQVLFSDAEAGGRAPLPATDDNRTKVSIEWERYPSVLRATLADTVYTPRPDSFLFAPLHFIELGKSEKYAGLFFPQYVSFAGGEQPPRITLRSLVLFAQYIDKPSAEFAGAVEHFELDSGLPIRAAVTLDGKIVSETIFEQGIPVLQRLDLDLDSRMETVRRFRKPAPDRDNFLDYKALVASSESDWDGDGIYETGEVYLESGSVVYSWDMDNDGTREYSETKQGN
jgi:hypothetical protein